ncbi:MAG: hypothetical protein OEM00_03980, partial [Burkholderiaceae bacterium]|nr:hypothetical protein [Burkholderiaceae bacterium]
VTEQFQSAGTENIGLATDRSKFKQKNSIANQQVTRFFRLLDGHYAVRGFDRRACGVLNPHQP